jgi:PAS domain-containing protein
MMLDDPVEWGDQVDKDEVMDFVFEHERITKVNPAIVTQFNASSPDALLGKTPAQLLGHDLVAAKARWRGFSPGPLHNETDERRRTARHPHRRDYVVIYDDQSHRRSPHQRDVTDRHRAGTDQSGEQLSAPVLQCAKKGPYRSGDS